MTEELIKSFERDERYIVVKRNRMTNAQERMLRDFLTHCLGIPTVDAVVIESDWPEYEVVWGMIEHRVTVQQKQPLEPKYLDDYLGGGR